MELRETVIEWINKLLEMETGEEIFLHVHSKVDQKDLLKLFRKELKILDNIDPVAASSVHVYPIFKDKRLWVSIRKVASSPTIGFKKDLQGNVERIELKEDADLKRRLRLMRSDGMTWEEIEGIEGVILPKIKKEIGDA